MFRHRPRHLRRAGPRHAGLRMLRHANRMMDTGQFAQAYPLLRRLADVATERGMPVRAAYLYLRAARARLEMGGVEDAFDLARRTIRLMLDAGQAERLRTLLPGMIDALEQKGYHEQAVALRAEARTLLGAEVGQPPASTAAKLPARCPSCNAPVRANEVTWVGGRTGGHPVAECAYCGSVLQAE
jgi:imidazolonepropionase-like amidohydrolase